MLARVNRKELAGACLVLAIGLAATLYAALHYGVGTLHRIGPGAFPIMLGGVMTLLGVALVIRSFAVAIEAPVRIEWRNAAVITASILTFAVMLRPVGVVPASAATVLISTFADKSMTVVRRALLVVLLTAAVILIFKVGLGIRVPLIAGVIY